MLKQKNINKQFHNMNKKYNNINNFYKLLQININRKWKKHNNKCNKYYMTMIIK